MLSHKERGMFAYVWWERNTQSVQSTRGLKNQGLGPLHHQPILLLSVYARAVPSLREDSPHACTGQCCSGKLIAYQACMSVWVDAENVQLCLSRT